eukprot:6634758-Prymnesium_polylepis.1
MEQSANSRDMASAMAVAMHESPDRTDTESYSSSFAAAAVSAAYAASESEVSAKSSLSHLILFILSISSIAGDRAPFRTCAGDGGCPYSGGILR